MAATSFKVRLKDAMAGESNNSFAKKCGLSEGTLRRYLLGNTFPPLDTLEKIAVASGCSLAWLASGENPEYHQDVTELAGASENFTECVLKVKIKVEVL